jgi:salicylate hydroxylase
MQDSWILAQAIGHTRMSRQPLASALAIFDSIRSPYYKKMFVPIFHLSGIVDVN